MKKLVILLALISLVAARELSAEVTGTPAFSGCNCRNNNEMNPIEVSVTFRNPSNRNMHVSYEFYDPNANQYRPGESLACGLGSNFIPPNGFDSCRIKLYTMRGGLNATSDILVRFTGDDGVETYTKTFAVEVTHHTSPYEQNIVLRIDSLQAQFEQLRSKITRQCYGTSCCGMLKVNQYRGLALSNLSQANSSLRVCALTMSWDSMADATNSLTAANDQFGLLSANCSAALSLLNTTQSRISSVAGVIAQTEKCGADVANSESLLSDANDSLKEAKSMIGYDDYSALFSKLSEANNSIGSSVSSMGKCSQEAKPNESILVPVQTNNNTNQSSNQTSSGDNSTLVVGGLTVLVLLVAIAFSAMYFMRGQPTKKAPPAPSQPPAPSLPKAEKTDMHADLETEFNDWLSSTQKK